MIIGANTCSYESDERQFQQCKIMYGGEVQKNVRLNFEDLMSAYTYHHTLVAGQQCPSRGKFPYTDNVHCAFCFADAEVEGGDAINSNDDDDCTTASETDELAHFG